MEPAMSNAAVGRIVDPVDSAPVNALNDFDICVALAQISIDSQMEAAWRTWKRRAGFSDTIDIFRRISNGKFVPANTGLRATFAPLKVSLAVDGGKLGQVKVTLPISSGTVKYFDEEAEGIREHSFRNWQISFITDLDKKPVDLKVLAQIDPSGHAMASDVIKNSGLPDSVFSIEYLFLKLTSVDLLIEGNRGIEIPQTTPPDARTKALQMLNYLLHGDIGDYMLGTVVRRNTRQATPTFALTDFIFNVRANWKETKASTLEYLGTMGGRPLPADQNAARLKLTEPWVSADQVDGRTAIVAGVMVIGKNVLMDRFVVPAFANKLGVQATQDGTSWTFASSIHMFEEHGVLGGKQKHNLYRGYRVTLRTKTGSNQISIDGDVYGKVHYDGFNPLDLDTHIEWLYVEGQRDLTGSVTLTGSDIAADFELQTSLDYKFSDYRETRHEISALFKVYSAISAIAEIWGGKSLDDLMKGGSQESAEQVQRVLNDALSNLAITLKQQAYIPPGGGVFTFSNPRFTRAGDLMLDIIYRAP
jgi:hypothetical protein